MANTEREIVLERALDMLIEGSGFDNGCKVCDVLHDLFLPCPAIDKETCKQHIKAALINKAKEEVERC